jgi:uncharacterized protein
MGVETTAATPIFQGQNFYVPRFEIKLRGQKLNRAVIRDVLEVSYTDSLNQLDSFDFVLNDWDGDLLLPKYSSPFDETGAPGRLVDNSPTPNFDPGAEVELYLGYEPATELPLMMRGEVVSVAPSFPASGMPTMRVRVLSPLYRLKRRQLAREFRDKTDSEIARAIANDLGLDIEIPPGQERREIRHKFMSVNNDYPISFLMERAQLLGYDIYIKIPKGADTQVLFFGCSPTEQTVFRLTWGRSLIDFTPSISTTGQASSVEVRGWNPLAQGNDRRIKAVAKLADLNLRLPDQKLLTDVVPGLKDARPSYVKEPVESKEEAEQRAHGILADMLKDMVTASGSTVGMPDLRAGRIVLIDGVGPRFSARYRITGSTHTIGGSGYTTSFSARLETLSPCQGA